MDMSQGFVAVLARWENVATMIGIWVLVRVFSKVFRSFATSPVGARLQPLAPLGLAQCAVWLPGLQPAEMAWGTRFMLALVLGFGAAHAHKILKQTGLGQDERIKTGFTADLPLASRRRSSGGEQ